MFVLYPPTSLSPRMQLVGDELGRQVAAVHRFTTVEPDQQDVGIPRRANCRRRHRGRRARPIDTAPDVRSDCTYQPIPTPTRIVVDRDAAASLRPTESVDRCG